MTADELEEWLKSEDSESSGWTGGAGGETVGHERCADIPSYFPKEYAQLSKAVARLWIS